MSGPRWCIDEQQTVHWRHCEAKVGKTTPYITTPTDEAQMIAHLARVDMSGGMISQRGPGLCKPCETCITP